MAMSAKNPRRGGRSDKTARDREVPAKRSKLDDALEDSFPGSDPVSATQPASKDPDPDRNTKE
jgi:hypothetical protein